MTDKYNPNPCTSCHTDKTTAWATEAMRTGPSVPPGACSNRIREIVIPNRVFCCEGSAFLWIRARVSQRVLRRNNSLCYTRAEQEENSTMPLEFSLIPTDTRLESNGDGAPLDISEPFPAPSLHPHGHRADRAGVPRRLPLGFPRRPGFRQRPLLKLPQQFYRAPPRWSRHLLPPGGQIPSRPLGAQPLGRVSPTPMFVATLQLEEFHQCRETPLPNAQCSPHSPQVKLKLFRMLVLREERGRRLLVGCPVVVSPLPREWSCSYRRVFPCKCF